jgi:predicted Zn-dependent protease
MTDSSDRRFCPQCGGVRVPAAMFCEFCGARLAPGDVATAAPPAVPSWRGEVESLLRRDDLDGAEAALTTALAEHPDDPDAFALQAHIALERSDVERARALIDRALELAPRSPFVRLQLADYWLRLGITPRARTELQQALHDCDGTDPALEAHLRQAIALVREHAKAEFGGVEAAGGFGAIGRAVHRLFQTKRARRRLDRLAGAAAADERGA